MTVSRQKTLPYDLDLVVDFVNTREIDHDLEELATPTDLAAWLHERGLLPAGVGLAASELRGFAGALAQLLVPVARAAPDGTWERVKACAADDCQWAFYDRSRNRAGRWCNMAVCGNRTKVRAYRSKRSA